MEVLSNYIEDANLLAQIASESGQYHLIEKAFDLGYPIDKSLIDEMNDEEEIKIAVKRGYVDIIDDVLNKKNLLELDLLLYYSSLYKEDILLEEALENGATDYSGAMIACSISGNLEVLESLADRLTIENDTRRNALVNAASVAAKYGRMEVIDFIIEKYGEESVHFIDAFSMAAAVGEVDIMKRLLREEDREEQLDEGLNKAARMGQMESIDYILELDSLVTYDVLLNAARSGSVEIFEGILDNMDEEFENWQSLLEVAALAGKADMISHLLKLGVDNSIDVQKNAVKSGNVTAVKKVLIKGYESELMEIAIEYGREEVVRYLAKKLRAESIDYAIEDAVKYKRERILNYLIKLSPASIYNVSITNNDVFEMELFKREHTK